MFVWPARDRHVPMSGYSPVMRATFLPFCRPSITEEDIAAVADVLRSGWITTGPKVAELEDMVAARTGAKHTPLTGHRPTHSAAGQRRTRICVVTL